MADKSRIGWTDATWNPTTGCNKLSPGCKHCYAEREWARLSANPKTVYFGREFTDVQTHEHRLGEPLRWTKPRRIFVDAMSDLFHEDVPAAFIAEVFGVMAGCPQHTFQLLTKRPERMLELLQEPWFEWNVRDAVKYWPQAETMTWPLANVWLGVSAEDQETADRRIPLLLQTPAAVRWVSLEPLLGPVDLLSVCLPEGDSMNVIRGGITKKIDWVVVGGESGPKARPMHPYWVRSLRDQCSAASVAFNLKQWGEWYPEEDHPGFIWVPERKVAETHIGTDRLFRVGKKAAGRLLDGQLHDAFPEPSHA